MTARCATVLTGVSRSRSTGSPSLLVVGQFVIMWSIPSGGGRGSAQVEWMWDLPPPSA